MDVKLLQKIIEDDELLEIGRKAIEDTLIEFRDSGILMLRNNGLVIRWKDGKTSDIIRLGPEHALKIGLEAIMNKLKEDE